MRDRNELEQHMPQAAAEFVSKCLFHRHRGVLDLDDKVVIFGNDGYAKDERSRREVDLMRRELAKLELTPSGFSVCADGYSWAMIVANYQHLDIDCDQLQNLLSDCWSAACRDMTTD